MARKLKPSEFYYNLARLFKRNDKDVQNEWEIFIEFMINELQRYGAVRLPNLGEFIVVQKGGKYEHIPIDSSIENRGKIKSVYIEPYLQVRFLPSDRFKEIINGDKLPRAEIKRMKAESKRKELAKQELEKQMNLAERQAEAIRIEREKRLERIAKQKARYKLSKKKQEELKEQDEYDPYDYGKLGE